MLLSIILNAIIPLQSRFKNMQQQQRASKCGFCEQIGHKIYDCCDPSAIFIDSEFHSILNENSEDPFVLFDWLNMGLLKTIKLIAHKNNISRTGTKQEIICTIMDSMFPNYPNPLWKHPQKQGQILINLMHTRTNQILTFQGHLIRVGIISDPIHSVASLHCLDIMSLDTTYHQYHRENRILINRYFINKSKRYHIKTMLAAEPEAGEQEIDNECSICYEQLTTSNEIRLQCSHRFCEKCVMSTLEKYMPQCALCRDKYREFTICDKKVHGTMQQYLGNI